MKVRRRRMLQGMGAAGVLALAGSRAVAQPLDPGAAAGRQLYGLPRHALVIGNGRYKDAPLRNPGNDAAALASQLKGLRFEVAQAIDAGRGTMLEAIEAYGSMLERQGAIGLFYFAGHGVQLAWRNYLVPVDADIETPDDLRERAVELNALLQRIVRARNPMNVIILDACRDNPFGSRLTGAQRGLSQFDAPPGSLLAYSTAPGNVASDGEGEHGVYTENLLRELKVPEAKIEDVFKRVRLHVRRRTKGQQIPWESTSLEEDFYFVPPQAIAVLEEKAARERKRQMAELEKRRAEQEAELKRRQEQAMLEASRATEEADRKRREQQALFEAQRAREESERKLMEERERRERQLAAEAERRRREQAQSAARRARAEADRHFQDELVYWEKASATRESSLLEAYLLRYPSGRFAELAQLYLDRRLVEEGEKRVQIVSASENPFSRGGAVLNTRYRVGDSYTYRVTDLYTRLEVETFTQAITKITDTEVIYDTGMVTDLLGNRTRTRDGRVFGPAQFNPLEFAIGRRWTTRFSVIHPKFGPGRVELDMRIVARETITVPAGTFDAFRIEGRGWAMGSGSKGSAQVNRTAWFAPDRVRRWIASEDLRQAGPKVIASEREELVSYRQS